MPTAERIVVELSGARHPKADLVVVVVVNWNAWQDTSACLASLRHLTYPHFEVVVVDNGSEDGSVERLRCDHPDVAIIENEANLGYAGGNNVGIRWARERDAAFIWILNNDTVVAPAALDHLVARAKAEPEVGMCGSTLLYAHNPDVVQALGGGTYNPWLGTTRHLGGGTPATAPVDAKRIDERLDYVNGASMLVSRELVETIGGLREDYFLYYEELDWALRARGHFRLSFAPESVVYHKEGASTGGSDADLANKSALADFFAIRNRLVLSRRFFPRRLPTVRLGLVATLLNRVRRKQWERLPWILRLLFTRDPSEVTPATYQVRG